MPYAIDDYLTDMTFQTDKICQECRQANYGGCIDDPYTLICPNCGHTVRSIDAPENNAGE